MALKEEMKVHQNDIHHMANLTKEQHEAIMKFSIREDMIITQGDKDGAKVIGDIDKYLKEINSQLNNKEIYNELPTDPFDDHQNTIINL